MSIWEKSNIFDRVVATFFHFPAFNCRLGSDCHRTINEKCFQASRTVSVDGGFPQKTAASTHQLIFVDRDVIFIMNRQIAPHTTFGYLSRLETGAVLALNARENTRCRFLYLTTRRTTTGKSIECNL